MYLKQTPALVWFQDINDSMLHVFLRVNVYIVPLSVCVCVYLCELTCVCLCLYCVCMMSVWMCVLTSLYSYEIVLFTVLYIGHNIYNVCVNLCAGVYWRMWPSRSVARLCRDKLRIGFKLWYSAGADMGVSVCTSIWVTKIACGWRKFFLVLCVLLAEPFTHMLSDRVHNACIDR